ncbi:hypothetical protein QJS66_18635 [Kocuria rhizophila]|nr:hypothetical protein QJS66_18635 [Kocuria rhizophila]
MPRHARKLVALPVWGASGERGAGNAFGVPGVRDAHFGRLRPQAGVERPGRSRWRSADVAALFPPALWTELSHELIYHGRRICHSRRPACGCAGG